MLLVSVIWCSAFPAPGIFSNLPKFVPQLSKTMILPGCGHWTQQERPRKVNEAIIALNHCKVRRWPRLNDTVLRDRQIALLAACRMRIHQQKPRG
jgi:hypothetical protein